MFVLFTLSVVFVISKMHKTVSHTLLMSVLAQYEIKNEERKIIWDSTKRCCLS